MLYGLVLILHVLVALFLIAVILLQGGRGGMGEALGGAAAQSLFGGGANTVMTRLTAVVAGLFMVTCLSLAMLSTARGRSVMDQLAAPEGTGALPLPLTPLGEQAAPPPTVPPPFQPPATSSSPTAPAETMP